MKQNSTLQLNWNDLVPYLLQRGPGILNLSSGNPIVQGKVVQTVQGYYRSVLESASFDRIVYQYNDPRGDITLRETLAAVYAEQYGFPVTAANVMLTPGTQTVFFYLSELARRKGKQVFFPFGPEYPGYCTHPEPLYRMEKPQIRKLPERGFQYTLAPGFGEIPGDTLFVIVSRPGNPTGKVPDYEAIRQLQVLCAAQQAFLVLDGAYTPPVPNITFVPLEIPWTERTLFTASLSKAGLAGERLGIVLAPDHLIKEFLALQNHVTILAPRLVQFVVKELLQAGVYQELSRQVIRPSYLKRYEAACRAIKKNFPAEIPYYIYHSGGSPFLWLWLEDFPGSTNELFFKLLEQKVIVAPSSVFYLEELRHWPHAHHCLRIGLIEEAEVIETAMQILSRVVGDVYG
jgi:valine--pyruvate aminotransferase